MLNWLRSLFGGSARPVVSKDRFDALASRYFSMKAKYDAAQSSDDTRRHWASADGLSARAANSLPVRKKLRERARLERDNNGYCGGMLRTLADDTIGTGPTLQGQLPPETFGEGEQAADAAARFNTALETRFWEWACSVGLAEMLHTAAQSKKCDGEVFILATPNPTLTYQGQPIPVQLGVSLIECDQVTTPDPKLQLDRSYCDGIEFDKYGQPSVYHMLKDHPGEDFAWQGGSWEYSRIPAENVIHVFRRDRPGQVRGVPEIASVLTLFAELRRFLRATLRAAEVAAELGACLLETEANADTADAPHDDEILDTLNLEFGMMTVLPTGVKASQLKAEHPSTNYPQFKAELLKEAGRPLSMPANIVTGTSAGYNFSSARMDCLLYRNSILVERELVWTARVLERIWAWWIREAALIPGYLPALPPSVSSYAAIPHGWIWPGFSTIDPLKEAQADEQDLANGTTTLSELCAAKNRDWEAVLEQRAREQQKARALGVTLGKEAAAPGAGAGQQPALGEDDDDEDAGEEEAVHRNGHARNGHHAGGRR